MFFSEKSHSPFPAIRSCVSSVAYAANAQHAPTCPWFLTGEIHPCSHEFHCAGSDVLADERKRLALREETSFCSAAPLVGGRKPVARGRSSADATKDSAQSNAASIVAIVRPFLICRYYTIAVKAQLPMKQIQNCRAVYPCGSQLFFIFLRSCPL